jgi:hypothetical protein
MSRWADAFATLSRGYDTSDRLRHIGTPLPNPLPICHDVSDVSCLSPSRERPARTPAGEAVEYNPGESAPAFGEAEKERAAIIEYDGTTPRAWAEGFARLDPDRPPSNVPPRR